MTGEQLTVFYDADCGVCRLTSLTLARLDWRRRLAFVPLQAYADGEPAHAAMARELHVRDGAGRWWRGGGAALRIAGAIPVLVPLSLTGGLPGIRGVVDLAYRFVADHRPFISHALRLEDSARLLRHHR
jgi:predicted DCC family thiol-disulfide oxidoreductase YuxK